MEKRRAGQRHQKFVLMCCALNKIVICLLLYSECSDVLTGLILCVNSKYYIIKQFLQKVTLSDNAQLPLVGDSRNHKTAHS